MPGTHSPTAVLQRPPPIFLRFRSPGYGEFTLNRTRWRIDRHALDAELALTIFEGGQPYASIVDQRTALGSVEPNARPE
jgi:hypothetical protein